MSVGQNVSNRNITLITLKGRELEDVRPTDFQSHKKTSAGNTKGGSITVPLTSCLTGLESAV